MYSLFLKEIKKICKEKVGSFYYSEGVKSLKNVRLITMTINEPVAYDLKIN